LDEVDALAPHCQPSPSQENLQDHIRDRFGANQWLERHRVIASLDLAKRPAILPGVRQIHGDLVMVDEVHRRSAADHSYKSLRYRLGELPRDRSEAGDEDRIVLWQRRPS